jgi:peptidoglycan/xylan/chitin deacetylase (PgdA/CDA1 family)
MSSPPRPGHAARRALADAARAVRRGARRMLGVGGGGPAILMYHRIAEAPYDPWRLAVSPARFEAQVAWLKRRRTVLPLQVFAELHRLGRLPRNAVAITFDDGYACNAQVAAPVLEALGVPATVFLTTAALSVPGEFWWDRLEHLVACAPAGRFEVQAGTEAFAFAFDGEETIRPGGAREAAYLTLWCALRPWAPQARRALLDGLGDRLGLAPGPRASHRVMTRDQAVTLAASRMVTLGAHSQEHPALSGLSPEARRAEIEGSRAAVAGLTGAAPELFAYPFGDYDEATVEAVAAAGFTIAVTTDPGPVAAGCDSLRLPRLQVEDWSTGELAARLEG